MTRKYLKSLILIVVPFITSCASVYISSLVDSSYKLSKADQIFIMPSTDAGIKEREFYALLKTEMIANGFHIVNDSYDAKYYLLFEIDTNTSQHIATSDYIGTYSYYVAIKNIYLNLYAAEELAQDQRITVWEGYIGVEKEEYEYYTIPILKALLDVFATNYQDHTIVS